MDEFVNGMNSVLNRLIETDAKSLNSISGNSTHSRKSSDTSQISVTSGECPCVKIERCDLIVKFLLWQGRVQAKRGMLTKVKRTPGPFGARLPTTGTIAGRRKTNLFG
jgi:hypothetical protein